MFGTRFDAVPGHLQDDPRVEESGYSFLPTYIVVLPACSCQSLSCFPCVVTLRLIKDHARIASPTTIAASRSVSSLDLNLTIDRTFVPGFTVIFTGQSIDCLLYTS